MPNGESQQNTCQELDACRNLKGQLIEEATKQFPFKEEYVSKKKLDKYIKLLKYLGSIYQTEEVILNQLPPYNEE